MHKKETIGGERQREEQLKQPKLEIHSFIYIFDAELMEHTPAWWSNRRKNTALIIGQHRTVELMSRRCKQRAFEVDVFPKYRQQPNHRSPNGKVKTRRLPLITIPKEPHKKKRRQRGVDDFARSRDVNVYKRHMRRKKKTSQHPMKTSNEKPVSWRILSKKKNKKKKKTTDGHTWILARLLQLFVLI